MSSLKSGYLNCHFNVMARKVLCFDHTMSRVIHQKNTYLKVDRCSHVRAHTGKTSAPLNLIFTLTDFGALRTQVCCRGVHLHGGCFFFISVNFPRVYSWIDMGKNVVCRTSTQCKQVKLGQWRETKMQISLSVSDSIWLVAVVNIYGL